MADVITRFKLETSQYDSKLRNAAKELSAFANNASKAGNEFQKFTKDNVEAARAFGNIATSATNAKDKVKELVGAYNDMAKAYNNLTKEQQQSDWGKAMAESMTTLKNRIVEAKKEMQNLSNTKMPDMGGGMFGGGKLDGMLQVFGGNLMTKVAGFAASAVAEMGNLVKESIKVAQSAEGIRIAYERLNRPDLMQTLKDQTHGVVSELELMKAAVKFNDFKLPVEELGTMLAFAQQKAKDTGQSVDYMVDSIVTGLGRKSLMILDNLGLSAAEIKDKMKETGDMTSAVGAIIREQMSKAGDYIETAADRAAKADADLQDAMLRLGDTFKPLSDSASNMWTNIKVGALDLLNNAIRPLIDALTEAGRLRKELANINASTGGQSMAQQHLGVLSHYSGTREQKQALANQQIAKYAAAEATAWRDAAKYKAAYDRELKNGGNNSGAAASAYSQWQKLTARAKAWQQTQADYKAGLDAVLNPKTNQTSSVGGTTTTPKTRGGGGGHTTKAILTEEQQNAQAISALQEEFVNASEERRLAIKAEIKVLKERNDEIKKLKEDALKDTYMPVVDVSKPLKIEYKVTADDSDALKKIQEIEGIHLDEKTLVITADNSEALKKVQEMDGVSVTPTTHVGMSVLDGLDGIKQETISIMSPLEAMNAELERTAELMKKAASPEEWAVLNDHLEKVKSNIEDFKGGGAGKAQAKDAQEMQRSWQAAAGAISSVGSALQQIDDPAAKIMGIIAQAIANVALGFAQASAAPATTSAGIFGWIAAAVAGTATMLSTIASIKSATSGNYAEGGIVPGNNFSGDNVRAYGLNSGELILNAAQQNSIAGALTGNRFENLQLSTVIGAESIKLIWKNNSKRISGRGEYVESRFR